MLDFAEMTEKPGHLFFAYPIELDMDCIDMVMDVNEWAVALMIDAMIGGLDEHFLVCLLGDLGTSLHAYVAVMDEFMM